MKKRYISPALKFKTVDTTEILSASGNGVTAPDEGIGSGGVDTGGDMDPDAKGFILWEEEE